MQKKEEVEVMRISIFFSHLSLFYDRGKKCISFSLLPGLVPLETTGEDLLGGVDALLALAALGYFGGLEGHLLEILVRSWGFEVSGTGKKWHHQS